MKPLSGFRPQTDDPSLSSQTQVISPPWAHNWEQGFRRLPGGDLTRQITLADETEAKAGRVLECRQILKMVYESHKLDEAIGQVFDIENIFNTTLKGDKLAKFLQGWDTVLAGQAEPISETILKPLLHRQLLQSPSLKEELAPI